MRSSTAVSTSGLEISSRRILRLALGTALSMGFSQIINWPLSFVAAVFTMFLLAVPLPRPTFKSGTTFVLALVAPAYLGMLLLPFLVHARWAGVILVVLALYGSFYYSARGGSPVMGMTMSLDHFSSRDFLLIDPVRKTPLEAPIMYSPLRKSKPT